MNQAQLKIKEWRENPIRFVNDCFGVVPDKWQEEGLRAFGNQDQTKLRLSLQACVGPGKSALLAWCGWNFLSCYGEVGHHPKGAAVSVTADNLKDNLWPEFSKWQGINANTSHPFLMKAFKWTKERIFAIDHPETWFISARSYSKDADPETQGRTLSGLHSRYVIVLIDESGEIPVAVGKAGEQALAERECKFGRILQAGNPTSLDGMLYAAANQLSHLWHVIRITGDPDDPDRSPRIDIDWAREQIKTYGRDNPWVMSTILGLFPPSSINTLLGPDEVRAAMNRRVEHDHYATAQKRLGIDVARFGDDRTIIFPRQGLMSYKYVEMKGARTNDIAARVAMAKAKWGSELEFVDGTGGWGAGVVDALLQSGHSPQEINFASSPMDQRYANKRAEMWFEMSKWIKRGGSLPNIPECVKEFTAPTYTFKSGKFMLEPKEQIKKRLGFSPDVPDALALTFAIPEMPSMHGLHPSFKQANTLKHEWDPYSDDRR